MVSGRSHMSIVYVHSRTAHAATRIMKIWLAKVDFLRGPLVHRSYGEYHVAEVKVSVRLAFYRSE